MGKQLQLEWRLSLQPRGKPRDFIFCYFLCLYYLVLIWAQLECLASESGYSTNLRDNPQYLENWALAC